ncbi:MAG TPA: hypothetical protein DF409_09040, partial [Bacteroidales bacterium]|nr:hypothetical protein [Bacteroidales bacterium]
SLVSSSERIWLDTSTITYYTEEFFRFDRAVEFISEGYKKLGASKLLWGSDYPCMVLYATYRQLLDIVRVGCESIPARDIELIMGKNALELFWNQ